MDYKELLKKAKKELPEVKESSERFKIPKVKGHIQGSKTIVNNFVQIANTLRREPAHFLKYVLKELATPGVINKNSLLMGARIPASRINEKIAQYAELYVFCRLCKKPDTKLIKSGNLTKIKCTACGASYTILTKI